MILVTGGCSQGKREFVRQYLGEQDADGFVWTEGEKASWEEFMDGRFCRDFQLFVRRVMEGSAGNGRDFPRTRFLNSFWRSCWPDPRNVFW